MIINFIGTTNLIITLPADITAGQPKMNHYNNLSKYTATKRTYHCVISHSASENTRDFICELELSPKKWFL